MIGHPSAPAGARTAPRHRCAARRSALCVCFLTIAALTSISCQASYPAVPTPTVARLEVQYLTAQGPIQFGTGFSYAALAVYTDGAWQYVGGQVTWSTSDPAIVEIVPTRSPPFRAIGVGTADVIATYQGFTASIRASVASPQPTYPRVRIPFTTGPSIRGGTAQVQLWWEVGPGSSQDVTAAAEWRSSNPQVVSVAAGRMTGIAPGTAEITASFNGLTTWMGVSITPASGL